MTKQNAEIYCLVGISGSGKTTLAREMIGYLNAVIVGRDPLREMLFGYTPSTIGAYYAREDFQDRERQVTDVQDVLVKQSLQGDISVILDNTHLQLKYINQVKNYGYPVNFIKVEASLQSAIEYDAMRERSVGVDVIHKQHQQFEHLCKEFDFAKFVPEAQVTYVQNKSLPKAFIFDIDGTLAHNTGRSPFDWKRVGEDTVHEQVAQTLKLLYSIARIILVSGRDEVCSGETIAWLKQYDIPYDKLYMRKTKDNRKDAVVKEEFWQEIMGLYHIIAMFDDRLQVIEHARSRGFTVFDVASNTF